MAFKKALGMCAVQKRSCCVEYSLLLFFNQQNSSNFWECYSSEGVKGKLTSEQDLLIKQSCEKINQVLKGKIR